MKQIFLFCAVMLLFAACNSNVFKGIGIAQQVAAKHGIKASATDKVSNGTHTLDLEYTAVNDQDNYFYNMVLLETWQELSKKGLKYDGLNVDIEGNKGSLKASDAEALLHMKAVGDEFLSLCAKSGDNNGYALMNPEMVNADDYAIFYEMVKQRFQKAEFLGFSAANLNTGSDGFILMYRISAKHRLQFNFEAKKDKKPQIYGLFLPDYSPSEIE